MQNTYYLCKNQFYYHFFEMTALIKTTTQSDCENDIANIDDLLDMKDEFEAEDYADIIMYKTAQILK